jgi:hypothetical protein
MAVLLALSVLVGCGTTGGVGGGVVGFDQAGAVPTVTAFSISPKTITLNAAQTVQFSLTARLSNGAIIDGASRASFVSSNANVTVSPTGLATGQLPGSAVITATIGGLTDTTLREQPDGEQHQCFRSGRQWRRLAAGYGSR